MKYSISIEPKYWRTFTGLVFIVFIIVYLLNLTLNKSVDHDENQYLASAYLVSQNGLWPYVDFQYHHMPFLTFIYALLFKFSSNYFLIARLFSFICVISSLLIVYYFLNRNYEPNSKWLKHLIPFFGILMIVFNPVFRNATSMAWSHDLPVFLILLSLLLFETQAKKSKNFVFVIISFLLTAAVLSRLTYVFVTIPIFLFVIFSKPFDFKSLMVRILFVFLGGIIAFIPLLVLIFKSGTENFIFSIIYFHFSLDPLYLENVGRHMTFSQRFSMLSNKFFINANFLFILSYLATPPILIHFKSRTLNDRFPWLMFFIISFLIFGFLIKEIVFVQYLYFLPFLTIMLFYQIIQKNRLIQKYFHWIIICCFAISFGFSFKHLANTFKLFNNQTVVGEVHRIGDEIHKIVQGEKVLTLSPMYVIEGGCEIYPQFANGVFQWRASQYLDDRIAEKYNVVTTSNFSSNEELVDAKYILVGFEKKYDKLLLENFKLTEFKEHTIKPGIVLYEKIRL